MLSEHRSTGEQAERRSLTSASSRFSPATGAPLITGTAAALAARLEVEPIAVRLGFLVLFLAGGWGVAFYGAAWLVLMWRQSPPATSQFDRSDPLRTMALGAVVVGLLLVLQARVPGFSSQLVWPAAVVALGLSFLWPQVEGVVPKGGRGDDARGPGSIRLARSLARNHALRVLGGLILVAGGLGVLLAANVSFPVVRDGVLAAGVVLAGTLLVFAPSVFRLTGSLSEERLQRIRADERAELAAHLHDSVLQTLTLIQKRSGDSQQMAALARHQERELRRWLYGDPDREGARRFSDALEEAVAEVEANHLVTVDNVTVGDALVDPPLQAVIAAAREALVNAAKFAGTTRIHQYAELTGAGVEVYVRDRGVGFCPSDVGPDRRGISESIVGRMHRAGGRGEVRSRPGEGTEVHLWLPRPPAP